MEIYKHYEEIYEIKNFLNDSTIEKLLSHVDLNENDGWINTHPGSTMHYGNKIDQNQFRELTNIIENDMLLFFNNVDRFERMHIIRRLNIGEFMHPHSDLGPNNNEKNLLFGVVVYLNDDFEGGELNYVDLGIKIKPTKGSLIIHKSTYLHEVLKVTSGKRYCITSFIWGNDNTKINIK